MSKNHQLNCKLSAAVMAALFAFAPVYLVPVWAKAPDLKSSANPFTAISSNIYQDLTEALALALHEKDDRTFAGGDAAYSVPLSKNKSLWLFGDSFFGAISGGKRLHCVMYRNSIALIDKSCMAIYYSRALEFFDLPPERQVYKPLGHTTAKDFLEVVVPTRYYWPGDGVRLKNKLYVFMHETADAPEEPKPFQFKAIRDHLLIVHNPDAEPPRWKWRDIDLNVSQTGQTGTACLIEGNFLYAYMTNPTAAKGFDKNPTALARINLDQLLSYDIAPQNEKRKPAWQYFTKTGWRISPEEASLQTLWQDGASEMSVTRIKGLPGFFSFYIPFDGKNILMRQAYKPEGPWSDANSVYKIPQKPGVIYYSAKAHNEYASTPGEVVLTYCNNTTDSQRVLDDASTYFPTALKIKLGKLPSP